MERSRIAPCKGCLNRYIGCHADCELYKNWKTGHEEDNKAIVLNKVSNSNFDPVLRDLWLKKQQKKRK